MPANKCMRDQEISDLFYIQLTRRMQDIVGRAFMSCVSTCDQTLHALALVACSFDRREGCVTGSNTSSNRICCQFIALYKTCLLTRRSAHIVAVVGRLSGL